MMSKDEYSVPIVGLKPENIIDTGLGPNPKNTHYFHPKIQS